MTQRSSHRAATRHQTCRSALHISLTALAVLSALAAGMPGEVRAQEAATQITLPAQSLDDALIQLGRQTSLQFFYTPETVFGLQAPAVSGNMTPEQALRRLLLGTPVQYQLIGRNVTLTRTAATSLAPITVRGRTDDEIGYDNVYEKDISNLYTDRQYLERYRGVSVGDVFAGMNGIYNIDNRNGSALMPNIRGMQGNGRIPVTVDGTVQSLDVWMSMQGINNRNYADPNMFRSIEVEKGPSMSRGIKSGIGGSVNIRTIEAADVIEDGKTWGIELKLGTASNSVKPSGVDPYKYVGMDYRDIPNATAGITYGTPGLMFYEAQAEVRQRSEVSRFNGDDRKAFISGAYKHEHFDILAAYSYSNRGNYIAGTKGAEKYMGGGADASTYQYTGAGALYPSVAKVYEPGWEVLSTSSRLESMLLKNNWYLPNDQKLSFNYTRNDFSFAEIPSTAANWMLWMTETRQGELDGSGIRRRLTYPYPNTTVEQKIYRLGYEWKPQESKLIDLEMSLWRTESDSARYQNGDSTYQMADYHDEYDRAVQYNLQCGAKPNCTTIPLPERRPNTDGRYNVFIGTQQLSNSVRTGLDISNRFQLSNALALTVAADYQYEKLKEAIPVKTTIAETAWAAAVFGPASGRRQEYGISANFGWQATDRLQISGGARYGAYWGFDDELDQARARQDPRFAARGTNTHQKVRYGRVISDAEMRTQADNSQLAAAAQTAQAMWLASGGTFIPSFDPVTGEISFIPAGGSAPLYDAMLSANAASDAAEQAFQDYKTENNIVGQTRNTESGLQIWQVDALVPLVDGKADRNQNPFYNGTLDANELTDAQGQTGVNKYTTGSLSSNSYVTKPADDPWRRPVKRRADAWSAQFVASYALTDRSRAYLRFSSMARFPTVYETASNYRGLNENNVGTRIQPERNNAWEIGYSHNLGGMLSWLPLADVKLSYFHNTIHDFYDRDINLNSIQFDRKILSGIELQARADTGRFYGNLGVTYRLRQDMCDKDYAVMLSPVLNRIPECMPGGFTRNLSFMSLQPKYSINLDLGTRLLENKLDLGARLRYHSSAKNKVLEGLLRDDVREAYDGTIRPYFWHPVQLIDLYAEYQFHRHGSVRLAVDNVFDRYYLDPLTKSPAPGPGRTIMLDLSLRF